MCHVPSMAASRTTEQSLPRASPGSAFEAKREAGPLEASPRPLQRRGLESMGEGVAVTRDSVEASKCGEFRVKENSEVLQLPHQCSILHQTLLPGN